VTKIVNMGRLREARGYVEGKSPHPTIAIRMTPELFALIGELARRDDIPFAQEARRLMTIGLGVVLADTEPVTEMSDAGRRRLGRLRIATE
jgi:hypothetical protein